MTTVGYGDHAPVTPTGRWVGAALMIGGIAILGTVTATIASWLVQHVDDDARETADLRAEARRLRAEAHSLRVQAEDLRTEAASLRRRLGD